ncbi:unnamed protein product [Phytophthora fragariaefolia]|uniref:Unnamed protein product n=1 Tax=Phytophthora fragariaefolia TaxID=1490495 RepID=A0A9W6XN18_9STRA|nr:unnamed protein product [Phytophthora fragariaefolia]
MAAPVVKKPPNIIKSSISNWDRRMIGALRSLKTTMMPTKSRIITTIARTARAAKVGDDVGMYSQSITTGSGRMSSPEHSAEYWAFEAYGSFQK